MPVAHELTNMHVTQRDRKGRIMSGWHRFMPKTCRPTSKRLCAVDDTRTGSSRIPLDSIQLPPYYAP